VALWLVWGHGNIRERACPIEASTVDTSARAQFLAIAQFKRCDLFHFLFLNVGRAEIKVLASKICLC